MDNYILEAKELTKIYKGRTVVDSVSINALRGKVTGLLGPNGAGKTTCFYMIAGLVKPENGQVLLNKTDITKLPIHKRAKLGLGYLSQEPSIFRKLSVRDNLLGVLQTLKISKKERQNKLEESLQEFGLEKVVNQKAVTLSGGERRRLEIARVLITNPNLILLDEPFSGIDPKAVYDIQQEVLKLRKKGISVLITDHNVRETLKISDYSYIMSEGKLLCSGTPEEIKNNETARENYFGNLFHESE